MALGLLGVAGTVLWWLIHLVVQPALWGQPGTAAYETYEAYNRMWPLPLALMDARPLSQTLLGLLPHCSGSS